MSKVISKLVSARDRYDWKRWENGKPYRAVKGEDFDCTVKGFRAVLYGRAKRRGLTVRVAIRGSQVDFQFSNAN